MAKAKKPKAEAKAPGKPGRPSKYSEALLESICERLSKGEPLAAICRDEGMPHDSTVRDWMEARPEVSLAIARAREAGYDAIAIRTRMTARGKGEEAGGDSSGDVQRDKLIIETDLKLLAKWSPRYGDKVQLAGHDGGALPEPPQWIIAPVAPKAE